MSAPAPSNRRLLDWLLSPGLPLLVFVGALIAVRPWGDFPLNDDWQYTHIADRFAREWEIHIDRPIAPALIVQTILGGLLIRLVGLSHLALRCMTMLLACATLVALDAILRRANVRALGRVVACAVVAFNPVWFLLSASFMTEVYGMLPALLCVYVWCGRFDESCRPTLGRALVAAVLAGIGYLTRQFSGLVLPCLALATLLENRRLSGAEARRVVLICVAAMAVFVAIVLDHQLWIRATGNFTPQFADPLNSLLVFRAEVFSVMGTISFVYLTAFLAPLIVLVSPRDGARRLLPYAAFFIAATYLAVNGYKWYVGGHPKALETLRTDMPFFMNLIYRTGLGPVTIIDVYQQDLSPVPLARSIWPYVERAFLLLPGLWVLFRSRLNGASSLTSSQRFFLIFGLSWGGLTTAISIQAYGVEMFDRYLVTPLFGAVIAIAPIVLERVEPSSKSKWRGLQLSCALALWLPVALFGVLGTHDYFRWQSARWNLYTSLLHRGVPSTNIDAGYEPNGWFNYDAFVRGDPASGCIRECRCTRPWFCSDESYRISFRRGQGFIEEQRIQPKYLLMKGPPLLLLRRPDP